MSFGSTTISTVEPKIGALSIQNSAFGLPIPLFWGTARLSGNLIWYGDFTAIAHTTTTESGGKGGGGVTSKNTSYTYTAAFIFGLSEGPLTSIGRVWNNKEKTTFAALGMTLLPGTLPQAVWSHLTTKHPTEALSYPGIAAVAHSAFDLGGSASLPQLSFEASGPRQFGAGIVDARPDEIITDLLTNALYGAGFPASRMSLGVYRTYTQAAGLFLSPVLNNQQPAAQHLEELLLSTNSAPLWSEGLLKLLPYGDSTVTGNGVTYTPAITPQYDLTDDDFIVNGADSPISVRRKPQADAYNQVKVEFRNRANEYNIEIAEAKDLGSISAYGLRARDPIRLHAICVAAVADKVVNTLLQRTLYIRNEYEFRLGWRHCLLEPMDIVTLTHAPLGLLQFQVRIKSIEEDANGLLRVIAEEFPFGVATPALITTQGPSGYSVDFNVAPGNANAPVIFEPPLSLSGQPEVWMGTSGGSAWGGAEVWVSLDNATYKQVGIIYGGARHGTLTAILPSAADPDIASTLAVDLTVSKGTLIGGTAEDRDLFNTLSYADGELVSFRVATLTAANKYSLTDMRRGVHGTPIGAHAIGTKFARLDQAMFRFAYTPDYLGKTVYVKLRSFNVYGAAPQELSAITPTTYAIVGAPLGTITGLALAQPWISPNLSVKWNPYAGAESYKVEVWVSGVLKRTVSSLADPAFEYKLEENLADGGPYRAIELRVFARHSTGQSTTAAILVASNPQVATPAGLSAVGGLGNIEIKSTTPADVDYAGTIVWAGTATAFVRDDAAKVYDGPSPVFLHILAGNTTRFYRVAHYDKLGKTGLNESSEVTATSILAGGVTTVSALPAATHLGQDVVYYGAGTTPDFKLYRWNGTAYIRAADGGDLLAASVTSDKVTVASLSAMSANLGSILSGNITLDAAGYIRGGSTGYLTGAGFWMGYHSGAYKFHIGDPAGDRIAWTGTALDIKGTLNAVTGTFGALTVAAGGNVKMGQTAYNTGAGFWLGDDAGVAKFSVGNPAGSFMRWTGTELQISGATNTQTFNVGGTWTKPTLGSMALIEVWGGGGSGGGVTGTTVTGSGGGGGGGYSQMLVALASLPATAIVVVGGGGTAVAATLDPNGTPGNPGGASSFNGTLVTAIGGSGGGAPVGTSTADVSGGAGGGGATGGIGTTAFSAVKNNGLTGNGSAGGGGGQSSLTASVGIGGVGPFSNNGGNGGRSGAVPTAGAVPGSGGGGSGASGQASAAGAAGRVRVTVF